MHHLIQKLTDDTLPEEQAGVDLRLLHEELGSKQRFADWAKKKLENFEEGTDYCLLHNVMKQTGSGGHNRKEYYCSLDVAKHIALMENTERGRMVRDFFIAVEKQHRLGISDEKSDPILDILLRKMESSEDPETYDEWAKRYHRRELGDTPEPAEDVVQPEPGLAAELLALLDRARFTNHAEGVTYRLWMLPDPANWATDENLWWGSLETLAALLQDQYPDYTCSESKAATALLAQKPITTLMPQALNVAAQRISRKRAPANRRNARGWQILPPEGIAQPGD